MTRTIPADACEGCEHLPGVLVCINVQEIQRCDTCRPAWSDLDAVEALQAAFPWVPVVFDPDHDEDGNVIDPEIGVYVIDFDRLRVPADAPAWLARVLRAARRECARAWPLPAT